MGEEFFEVLVVCSHLQHPDALAGEEGEIVVVVEGDGVVGNLYTAVEPSGTVDGEAQRGFGGGGGRDIDGGKGSLASVDKELHGKHLSRYRRRQRPSIPPPDLFSPREDPAPDGQSDHRLRSAGRWDGGDPDRR